MRTKQTVPFKHFPDSGFMPLSKKFLIRTSIQCYVGYSFIEFWNYSGEKSKAEKRPKERGFRPLTFGRFCSKRGGSVFAPNGPPGDQKGGPGGQKEIPGGYPGRPDRGTPLSGLAPGGPNEPPGGQKEAPGGPESFGRPRYYYHYYSIIIIIIIL